MGPPTDPNPGSLQRPGIHARLKSHIAANASGSLQVAVSKAPRPRRLPVTRTYVAGALPIQH